MLEKILKIKKESSYDFKKFVFPSDPLAYLFEDWVDYYHMKYAICKAISPQSILEVGVRYGYSAITFLSACSEASYLGIDNNSAAYGGSPGCINWAKEITRGFNAKFLIADTQTMTTFPGEFYDFIHIDGQQDGDGTYHDLEMALEKGRYILLDGYFWSRDNMLSSTFFLEKYRNFVEYSIIVPGYAGELLIKTKPEARHIFAGSEAQYVRLRDCYDKAYYLRDCGGHELFKKYRGLELEDSRLLAVYYLANPDKDQKILDIGCGRGELSYALSQGGAMVVGVDYSKDSIQIARKTYQAEQSAVSGLDFFQGDILECSFPTKFDAIIAADLIEHLEQESLEKLFDKVAGWLKKRGLFIIHTAPNKLGYLYSYRLRRRRARETGLYLPKNPRTYYEDLMHINEQTPAKLHRSLKKRFACVYTWVTTLPDVAGSLRRTFSKAEFAEAASILSVASNERIEKEKLLLLVTQEKLNARLLDIDLSAQERKLTWKRSEAQKLNITIQNKGKERLVSLPPYPVNISYHWLKDTGEMTLRDGIRTPLRLPILPLGKRAYTIEVIAPEEPGDYVLQVTLVQEQNFWFEQMLPDMPWNVNVSVV